MSYILDALKKVEHEKQKRSRDTGKLDISIDLFRERDGQSTKRLVLWKFVALIVTVALLACVITFFVLKGDKRTGTSLLPSVRSSIDNFRPVAAGPVMSPRQAENVPAPVIVAPVKSQPEALVDDEESGHQRAERLRKQSKVQPTPVKPIGTLVQAPADIKLSGIAWQDDRAGRRAVVNGFLLKEGTLISGARIVDIKADRVRFSSAAGQFEIKLDAVLPSIEVVK